MYMYVCVLLILKHSYHPTQVLLKVNSYYCGLITLFMYFSIDNDDNVSTGVIIGSVLGACAVVVIVILLVVVFKKYTITMKDSSRHHSFTEYNESSHTARSLII